MAASENVRYPNNEANRHIYDAFYTVKRQIEERAARDPEYAADVIARLKAKGHIT